MNLHESKPHMDLLTLTLTEAYGRQAEDTYITGLIRALGQQEAESAVAAVKAHIIDTTEIRGRIIGTWPPKPADILKRLQSVQMRPVAQSGPPTPIAGPLVEVKVPDMHVNEDGRPVLGTMRTILAPQSRCRECSDTGIARFYHDHRDTTRVYLASEFLELPAELLKPLKVGSAICDCQMGNDRPERNWTHDTWSAEHGGKIKINVYPRMKRIRQLAARRRERDTA